MREEKALLTEKEIQRIRKAIVWGNPWKLSATISEPLKVCDCREEKILTKVMPRGAGFNEVIIEIMCMGCGKKFEGFVDKIEDKALFDQKVSELKKEYGI